MTLTFKAHESQPLAGIPATVVDVWPRFRSGDFLVTLEYAEPVTYQKVVIKHIDAFMSELEPAPATRDVVASGDRIKQTASSFGYRRFTHAAATVTATHQPESDMGLHHG